MVLTEVSNPYNIKITKNITVEASSIVDNRPLVDLSYYAMLNIANYNTITELPQEHIDYLNSVRGTNMEGAFASCESLTSLDVSKWDTSKVTSMNWMFYQCYSLTSLDVSNWDTSKVIYMNWMFIFCEALTTIIGAIDMTSCTDCGSMFNGCNNLKGVHLKNVPRNLDLSSIGGTEGSTYIIDNYID